VLPRQTLPGGALAATMDQRECGSGGELAKRNHQTYAGQPVLLRYPIEEDAVKSDQPVLVSGGYTDSISYSTLRQPRWQSA
jgi:hypothetical protein